MAAPLDPRLQTRATSLFGVQYPIVQTGMGWVANARLTAATANAGGLGIIAAAPMTFDQMRQAIDDVSAATDKPFGVNLRTDAVDISEVLVPVVESMHESGVAARRIHRDGPCDRCDECCCERRVPRDTRCDVGNREQRAVPDRGRHNERQSASWLPDGV